MDFFHMHCERPLRGQAAEKAPLCKGGLWGWVLLLGDSQPKAPSGRRELSPLGD
jgi:hypothetical protein